MRAIDATDTGVFNKVASMIHYFIHQVARDLCVRFMDIPLS